MTHHKIQVPNHVPLTKNSENMLNFVNLARYLGRSVANIIRREISNKRAFTQLPQSNVSSFVSSIGVVTRVLCMFISEAEDTQPHNQAFESLIPKVSAAESDGPPHDFRDQFNFIDKVVKKCAAAVVYIEIKDPRRFDPETGQPATSSNGSGFIIRDDGWILTNAHVVINKPQSLIMVMMHDGTTYPAILEHADLTLDLALLKIYSQDRLPSLKFAKPNDVAVGEWVVALGSPLSLSHSVTVGVVSAIKRSAEELGLNNFSMQYLQTDASITYGNSGGPLVNLNGDVIGINNLRITSGISFAIPIEYASKFLETTRYSAAYKAQEPLEGSCIGITTISLTPALMRQLVQQRKIVPEEVQNGVLVWKVLQGTPAHKSGLEAGDIITHVNGVPIREAGDIYILHSKKSDPVIHMDIVRSGKKKSLALNTQK